MHTFQLLNMHTTGQVIALGEWEVVVEKEYCEHFGQGGNRD